MSGPVDHPDYEYLGEKEGAPYGHTAEFGYATAVIGEEPGEWYFTPEDLRRVADEVEERFEEVTNAD